MVSVKKVSKVYGAERVLDQVSVSFARGQIHGLIGRNGSGKTMLLKCICGLTPVTEGVIRVGGKRIGRDVEIPESVGAIIETPGFLPNYSGYNNLKFLAGIKGRIGAREVREAMEFVGLDPDQDKWVSKYSLGMRQRLGIAQAIMENPRLLILDEPMNGLDNAGVRDVRRLLKSLRRQGKTILITSHNPLDINALCDTVCEMEGGRLRRLEVWK